MVEKTIDEKVDKVFIEGRVINIPESRKLGFSIELYIENLNLGSSKHHSIFILGDTLEVHYNEVLPIFKGDKLRIDSSTLREYHGQYIPRSIEVLDEEGNAKARYYSYEK